ncbi:DNA internalization-related competence protein ComEC/Rec2 [Pasteurellaceae bacterium 22721_9_1]
MAKFWFGRIFINHIQNLINIDWLVYSLILSAISLYYLPETYLLYWWQALASALLFGACSYCFNKWTRIKKVVHFLCLFSLTLGYFHFHALSLLAQANFTPYHLKANFKILKIQQQKDYQTLIIELKQPDSNSPQRLYTNWQVKEMPKMGEVWQGNLHIRPISSRLNQGGFDRQAWYLSQGITATARIKSAVKISQDFSWREKLFESVLKKTQGLKQQGLLLALGFGERAWLEEETKQLYQNSNTAHLMAISGLHIGLAMAIGFWLGRIGQYFLPTHWITPTFPILAGLLCAIIYAQLAGFAVPTFRAIVALCLLSLFRLNRGYHHLWQLFFAGTALLLCCDPMMILSTSFYLSVGAVGSLLLWYQLVPFSVFSWQGKVLPAKVRWIFALFHLQCGLFLFFAPIQVALFGAFSWQSLFANLLIVPLFSFVLVPIVLLSILMQGAFESWQFANFIAEKITSLLIYFQQGWIYLSNLQIMFITFIICACCLLWLILVCYQAKPFYWLRNGMAILCSILLVKIATTMCLQPDWRVEMLDVGQGLSVLIVKNQRGILYDTGASWGNSSMAEVEILPYLRREGIDLDYVVVSHDDNDHSGGARKILQAYPNAMLISASQQNYQEKHRTFCQKDQIWQWQGLKIEALSPTHVVEKARNADSCVLLISDQKHRLLLLGDADTIVEQQILARFGEQLGEIDILQVGHHGSKTSTSQALIKRIDPQISLISTSRWNPWQFPHSVVLQRLKQAKSAVYNSAVSGQVSLQITQDDIKIKTARNSLSPWYQQIIGQTQRD